MSAAAAQLVAEPNPNTFPLKGITNVDYVEPLNACVGLNRRLLTSFSSFPEVVDLPWAVL
jgi:hypothetical protein